MPARWLTRADYTLQEVQAIVGEYAEIRYSKHRAFIFVRVADLERVWHRLPPSLYTVLVLHGLLHIPQRKVAKMTNWSQATVSRRYESACEHLLAMMNGDDPV